MSTSLQTNSLFSGLSGRAYRPTGRVAPNMPLVVALHGGTYTSSYFDIPGASLFEKAVALEIPMIAPDRPGYATSPWLPPAQMTIEGQARFFASELNDAWQRHGEGTSGIVLIGHSIGGAIAAATAACLADELGAFPLLGLAISGVCLNTPPEHRPLWEQLPDTPSVDMPPPAKAVLMFGPEGSFDPQMIQESARIDVAAPKAELVDIVSTWSARAASILGRIAVPVHYRQADTDRLWVCGPTEVDGFARALAKSPRVDAAMLLQTGHCIDLHHLGSALQLQQLGFALQCATEHRLG